MIWRPQPGQRVVLWYRAGHPARSYHGTHGRIHCVASGRSLVNVLVELDRGGHVVAPRGNLRAEPVHQVHGVHQ